MKLQLFAEISVSVLAALEFCNVSLKYNEFVHATHSASSGVSYKQVQRACLVIASQQGLK